MQDPERYEKNKSIAQNIVDVYVTKIISAMKWSPNENILDYGCGAGSTGYNCFLPKIEEFNSKMYSVDSSSKMLAYAKQHYLHEKIQYSIGNIIEDEFPFENVKFDKIFAINVFQLMKDIRKVLAGFNKIMKPGGQLGFSMFTAECLTFRIFRELGEDEFWKPYMKNYEQFFPSWSDFPKGQELKVLKDLFESYGFRVRELDVLQREYHFETWNTILEIVLSVNPCIDDIPTDLYEPFKMEMKKRYIRHTGVPADCKTFDFNYQFGWGVVEKVENI